MCSSSIGNRKCKKLDTLDAAISPSVRAYTFGHSKVKNMRHLKFEIASKKTEREIVTW